MQGAFLSAINSRESCLNFIEKMEEENLSVRSLAKKASVSPTVIQKLRNNDSAEKITYSTFLSVIKSLGYRMKLEKI